MPTYDPKITLGNYLTIGVLIVSMALAYGKLATREELQMAIEKVKAEYVSREVNSLQIQLLSRQVEDLNATVKEVRNDVKEIKRWVK